MIFGEVLRVVCDMISIQTMTAEGTPVSEMSSLLKLHEFKVGLYQKSLRQTSEKRLKRALKACTDADLSLKSASQGYTALEKLICTL